MPWAVAAIFALPNIADIDGPAVGLAEVGERRLNVPTDTGGVEGTLIWIQYPDARPTGRISLADKHHAW